MFCNNDVPCLSRGCCSRGCSNRGCCRRGCSSIGCSSRGCSSRGSSNRGCSNSGCSDVSSCQLRMPYSTIRNGSNTHGMQGRRASSLGYLCRLYRKNSLRAFLLTRGSCLSSHRQVSVSAAHASAAGVSQPILSSR